MSNSGKANPIAVLAIVAIAAAIYVAAVAAPAWTDNIDVQDAVNIAVAQSEKPDDMLRDVIRDKLRYVGTHKEDDGYGTITEVSGLGLTDDQIDIERNDVKDTITVSIDYTREVQLRPTKKIWTLHFHPSQTGPIKHL